MSDFIIEKVKDITFYINGKEFAHCEGEGYGIVIESKEDEKVIKKENN